MSWMEHINDNIVMFYPHVPEDAIGEVASVLRSRWIGQGPKVPEFESLFESQFGLKNAVSVNSGTAALHLAYILAGIAPGDEVVCPLFTCTATNIPLLYLGAIPVFVDVNPNTMNIDIESLKKSITKKTKAIVTVDFGGLPCEYDEILEISQEFGIPLIQDAAHSLGSSHQGKAIGSFADFTIFSLQAIKHLTTGDGGILITKDEAMAEKARRLRWFGIDRNSKSRGIWENDISEVGYKYHMNDIAAAIGIAGLREFNSVLEHRTRLSKKYYELLAHNNEVKSAGFKCLSSCSHGAWMHTIIVDNRDRLMRKLQSNHIESSQVHYRNDRYSIFKNFSQGKFPQMDSVESKYLCLPIHTKMTLNDVSRICEVINSGW